MKALSKEDVKRLALSHGARLELGGKAVNSARLQVVGTKSTETKVSAAYMPSPPKVEPPQTIEHKPNPEFREAISSIENYASAQFLLSDQTAQTMNAIKDMLKNQVPAAEGKRPVAWVFKVKRDAQGLMETITATAKF